MEKPDRITQAWINQQVEQMLKLQREKRLHHGRGFAEMNADEQVTVIADNWKADRGEDIYLASVPKVAINLALVHYLERLEQELEISPQLDKEAIVELFGRQPNRLSANPLYEKVLAIPRAYELIQEGAKSINNRKRLHELRQEFADLIPNDFSISITLQELLYQALALSSNNATRIAKRIVVEAGGDIDAELHKLVPNYSPSPINMARLEHWLADKPNVGPLQEHASLLHDTVVRQQLGQTSEGENMVLNELTNNPQTFHHCFTHSKLGQELIATGYKIIEKTGYYPCVFWIHDFAKKRAPHMLLATIFSIVSPTGKVTTFAYNQMYAVNMPITVEDRNIDGEILTFPQDTQDYTQSITDPIKKIVNKPFRHALEIAVSNTLL